MSEIKKMPDEGKTMLGINCCAHIGSATYSGSQCEACPYKTHRISGTCKSFLADDARVLLEERRETIRSLQEAIFKMGQAAAPRVMTLDELKRAKICWIEDADDGMESRLFPAVVYGTGQRANDEKSIIVLAHKPWCADSHSYEWWYDIKDYRKWWRPWTSKPSKEQMEAEAWDD